MGSQRSNISNKNDQSLIGILWVAKGQIFLTKNDQSLMGSLWVANYQIFLTDTD